MLNCKVFGQTIKSPIFLTLSFVLIVFVIYACSSIYKVSLYPSQLTSIQIFRAPQQAAHNNDVQAAANKTLQVQATSPPLKVDQSSIIVVSNNLTEQINIEELEEEEQDGEAPDPLIPPAKVTNEERMEWFRKKLPDLEVLKSTNLSRSFHDRVVKFSKNQCATQFFMIWFSPARTFGPRDFLAADTLMKANPQSCLVLISRSLDTRRGYKILKPLLDRGFKILTVTPDLPSLVKDTPAEAWLKKIKSGKIDPGKNPLSIHLSDLIRLAVLYKYGGVYLDTDFVILKDFKGLRNAVGAQGVDQVTHKWTTLNGAAMVFDKRHPILFDFLQEFTTTFDGSKWGHNGPYLLTRVIQRVGNTPGYNLTILGLKAFYPVNWIQINGFYKKPVSEEESKWVEETVLELNKETYGLHLWNKITRELVINEGSVIDRLIKSHCLICRDAYNS
ncbi:Gb3 synth domain-containing protein [Citrus sinensis]|uniref:Gb3 synth domain-containing protein n=1 Tax=Citrus sinensis TaxID=2711 RepID=A0ACB8JXI2_CITSI|nr:Gb3 synth domain-containing protein [Citrus sinensis]